MLTPAAAGARRAFVGSRAAIAGHGIVPLRRPKSLPASLRGRVEGGHRSDRLAQQLACAATPSGEELDELNRLKLENAELRQRIAELEELVSPDGFAANDDVRSDAAAEVATPPPPPVVDFDTIPLPSSSDAVPFWESAKRAPTNVLASGGPGGSAQDPFRLRIVHLTAEMAPIAKVGGLGDVVTGLARSCTDRGHDVEVILPFYECIDEDLLSDLKFERAFDCPRGFVWDGQFSEGAVRTLCYSATCEGCRLLLLRPDWDADGGNIFRGGRVYAGSYNETEAYLYFCRAGLEVLQITDRSPDVLHLHEWQTSAAAMLFWETYHSASAGTFGRTKVVLTIHNMDNTGECRAEEFGATGVDGSLFNTVEKALDERTIGHNPERLSLLKGGIVYSNAVTTVSPTYAEETRNGHGGGWLSGTLSMYSSKYHGILNGIDDVMWDPRADAWLPPGVGFSPDALEGKRFVQRYVRSGLGLREPNASEGERVPLVVCITRLVPQKGVHLIRHAIFRTLAMGGQFVLLGSGHCDGEFRHLAEHDLNGSPDARLLVTYSETLSHYLFAAADVVLVPSIFEPCGLTQMIGMRYGAVPVVRRTGGLADTVRDVDDPGAGEERRNGFVFEEGSEAALEGALDRAVRCHKEREGFWNELVTRVMRMEWGWGKSAQAYVDLYQSVSKG